MGSNGGHFANDPYRDADGIRRVVREGLCHRCGACVGLCPVGTFTTRDGFPDPVHECIHCNICVRVCSGLAVDYPAIGRALYGDGYQFGSLAGPVRSAWIAHAADRDIRLRGASGGVVTGALAYWLGRERIRGAVVTVEDPDEPTRGRGLIARTRDDLMRSPQSRYTTAPTFAALWEIRDDPGPFAAVGLPCQIHALRQRQLVDPRWARRVPIVVGLLCHYNLPWEAVRLAAETFAPIGARPVRIRSRERDATGWPNNTLEITYSDGSAWRSPLSPQATFNIVSRVAPLGRCLMCMDACAEFADFAVGDPWIRGADGDWKYHESDGDSLVLVHTEHGGRLWDELIAEGAMVAQRIPVEEAVRGQFAMMSEKKERVAFRLRLRRRLGWPIPRYPMGLPATSRAQALKEVAFWFTRLNTWSRGWQRLLLRLGFGPLGRWMVRRRVERRKRAARRDAARASSSDFC